MRTNLSLPAIVGLSLLAACNGSVGASARSGVDDETGQRSVEGRVAAEGAATVTAEDADSAQPLGSADVGADGRYAVEFEGGAGPVVVTAFDASGAVVGAVLVDGLSGSGEVTVAAPIDAETTLEAEVALAIADLSGSLAGVNTVDMRGRVSAAFAAAIDAAGDADAAIRALAMAEIAATEAADLALSSSGSAFGGEARLDASLAARQAFDAALDAGEVEAEAQAAFDAAVAAAWAAEGVSMSVAADADTAARATFDRMLDASLAASGEASLSGDAGSESLSARFATAAVMEALAAADADAETTARAEAAGSVLIESMLAGEASGPAWSAWAETWLGDGEVEAGLLGDTLAIGADTVQEADALISASTDAAVGFAAEVKASASAAIAAGAGGEASVASLAGSASWQAYAVYRADVEGSVLAAPSELVNGEVSATTELLVRAAAAAALSEGAE